MYIIWIIVGAIIGGTLGWFFDRRFMKQADGEEQCRDETVST